MAWSHTWGSPELLTIAGNGRRLMVPRQSCLVCGTSRNPFNNVLTYFSRDLSCRDLREDPKRRDYTAELRDLDVMLASLDRQGEPVDKWHTGRKRKATSQQPLPLPYKD